MKNTFKRALAAILVLSMLLVCFVGCKDDGPIDPEQAIKMIAGTARNMGIEVVE